MVELRLRIQRQKQRQHIGKAEAPENAAAHCRHITKLNADDMSQALVQGLTQIRAQPLMLLQIAQVHHRSDRKSILRLYDPIQSQI